MIVVRLQGGLGNQMFQYALARSIAVQLNTDFLLDARFLLNRTPRPNFTFREYDLSIFNLEASFYKPHQVLADYEIYVDKLISTVVRAIKKWIPFFLKKYYIEQHFHFDTKFLANGTNIYCLGYFQSYKYFEPIKSILQKDFGFKNAIDTDCLELLNQIKNCNSVCVHIRRGDYVNNAYYTFTSITYYAKALELLRENEKNIQLFLFSDDIDWCKVHVNFSLPITFVEEKFAGNKAKNHFELMQNCKHFIISNSSFAWWAAYLSSNDKKMVFAPQNWFQDKNISTKDLFPDEWIIIS